MTPGDLIQRVKRLFFNDTQSSAKQAASARAHRHDVMVALQHDVRDLQQQITDLSERENIDPSTVTEDESPEMASLHRKLSVKQRELARYQARI